MAKVTINDIDVDVAEGTPVIAAADKAGVFIPRFCYHPDLTPAGNCRICQVEIEGAPKLMVSCMTPVKDGMVVRTDTDKVEKAVQGDLEFLLLNHPVDCPICDQAGECYLQDFYMQVGLHDSRIPLGDKVRKSKVVDLGQAIVLDSERCVMCSRCIRFSDEVSQTHQFGFFQRGSTMEIGTFRGRPLDDPYAGCYADVCPVGALTSKDFRFQSRVWFLERTDSVCPHCSTGCNIRVDHKDEQVYRFVPRRNPEVNQSWMCDIGRMSYKQLRADRVERPLVKRDGGQVEVRWDDALAAVAAGLEAAMEDGPEAVAGVATPSATCEELWAFRRLLVDAVGTPQVDYRVDPTWERVDEREDQVLRRADHHPNSRGAELLGLVPDDEGDGVAAILERAAEGKVKFLYLLGPELLQSWPDQELVARALAGAAYVAVHTARREDLGAAADAIDAVLPAASFAELDGTFVNHARRLQRVRKAVAPPGEARSAAEVVAALESRVTGDPACGTAAGLFAELAAAVSAFDGLRWERLGPLGVSLGDGQKNGNLSQTD